MCDMREALRLMGVETMTTRTTVNNLCAKRPVHKAPPRACGCSKSRVCKHLYQNLRSQHSADAERHTEEETEGGLLGGPPQQTYFRVMTGKLITPFERSAEGRRDYKHLRRKSQRL